MSLDLQNSDPRIARLHALLAAALGGHRIARELPFITPEAKNISLSLVESEVRRIVQVLNESLRPYLTQRDEWIDELNYEHPTIVRWGEYAGTCYAEISFQIMSDAVLCFGKLSDISSCNSGDVPTLSADFAWEKFATRILPVLEKGEHPSPYMGRLSTGIPSEINDLEDFIRKEFSGVRRRIRANSIPGAMAFKELERELAAKVDTVPHPAGAGQPQLTAAANSSVAPAQTNRRRGGRKPSPFATDQRMFVDSMPDEDSTVIANAYNKRYPRRKPKLSGTRVRQIRIELRGLPGKVRDDDLSKGAQERA